MNTAPDEPEIFDETGAPRGGQDDRSASPDRNRGRTVPLGAFLAAILVALALGTLAVVSLAVGDDDASMGSDREAATEARLAAARFADRFLTYAYDDMGSWREAVAELSTGGFAQEVGDMEASLTELLAAGEVRARSQVAAVYLGSVDGSSTSVIVRFDRVITDAGGERLETNGYTRFDMVHTESGWLVEDVVNLADPSPIVSSSGPGDGPGGELPPEPESDDE